MTGESMANSLDPEDELSDEDLRAVKEAQSEPALPWPDAELEPDTG